MSFYSRRSYGSRYTSRRRSAYKAGKRAAKRSYKYGSFKRGTATGQAAWGVDDKTATEAQKAVRKELGIRGRGGYWGELAGGALGGLASRYLGINDQVARSMGASAGGYLEDRAKSWFTGRGNYVTNALVNGPPNADIQASVITNREFLMDINQTSAFTTLMSGSLNPGLATMFPWLSTVANNYEHYEFIQLLFEFRSMVTEGDQTSNGSLIMVSQSNPTAFDFNTKRQMENYNGAKSCRVNDSMIFGIECEPSKKAQEGLLYVRNTEIASNEDLKDFDMSRFQVAYVGGTANRFAGELYVHYTVKLCNPKINIDGQNAIGIYDSGIAKTLVANYAYPFGAYAVASGINANTDAGGWDDDKSGVGMRLTHEASANNFNMNFPDNLKTGYFVVRLTVYGNSSVAIQYFVDAIGCTLLAQAAIPGNATTPETVACGIQLTAPNAYLKFSPTASASLATSKAIITVYQVGDAKTAATLSA
jgi:hypothetical protein